MIFLTEKVIEGLDQAVMTMNNGEIALVTIPPEYAFLSTESKQDLAVVPANSTVIYEVELVSFVKVCISSQTYIFDEHILVLETNESHNIYLQEKESWDMNTAEKIEAAAKKKEEGNALFKMGKYMRASKRYEKVLFYVFHQFLVSLSHIIILIFVTYLFCYSLCTGFKVHRA